MNPQPSLFARLMADTPDFFKKADILGYLFILAAAVMAYFKLPAEVCTIVGTIGASFSALSKCAVKDATVFAQGITGNGLTSLVTDLLSQFAELKAQLATPTPLPTIENAFQDLAAAVKDNTAAKPDAVVAAEPAPVVAAQPETAQVLPAPSTAPASALGFPVL